MKSLQLTDKVKSNLIKLGWGLLFGFGLLLFTTLSYFLIKPFYSTVRNGVVAQAFGASLLAILGITAYFVHRAGKLDFKVSLLFILLASYILGLTYMLYSPASVRQHDVFSPNFDAHETYAWIVYSEGKLPSTNDYQFYHPPLNALVQATWMHIIDGILGLFGAKEFVATYCVAGCPKYLDAYRYALYSSAQILSVMYRLVDVALMMAIVLIFMKQKEKFYILPILLVAFFPGLNNLSGQLNNDPLSFMFSLLGLYACVRWWKKGRHIYDIVICAIAIGLGMMAKLTSATVCLPIAVIFIWEFVDTLRKKEGSHLLWPLIGQYVLFLAICAPLGLWFQVYAKIRFDQNFGFVFDNLNPALYTGDHSLFERFIIAFSADEYFGDLYCRAAGNINLFNYSVRCSIFGEYHYWQGEGFAFVSLIMAFALCFLVTALLVKMSINRSKEFNSLKKENKIEYPLIKDIWFYLALVLSQVLSECYFYLQMPYGCTMDFRYTLPLILSFGLTAYFLQSTFEKEDSKGWKETMNFTCVLALGFLVFSNIFYMVCI